MSENQIVVPGSGKVMVNAKTLDDYFGGLPRHKRDAVKPLESYPASKEYDFYVHIKGGGITGHAGAMKMGIARALIQIDPAIRGILKKEGLLTRDDRMVERKKPGRPKARKRFQYSKR
jgi:small subunit ribosomal protein S9